MVRVAIAVMLVAGCGGRQSPDGRPPDAPRPLYQGCIDGRLVVSHGPDDFDPVDPEDCEQEAPLPDSDRRVE